jgi:signal transduction histidine kinase
MRDGLVVLDSNGEVVVHNPAAGPLLKQLHAELPDLTAHHVCEGARSLRTECRGCLFSPEVGPRSCVVEIEGGVFEIQAAQLEPDADGRSGRVLVSRDVSDRIAQDERQIHQERLAVLGEVAAVMAHELNNPLAAISMYNQMLATELGDDPRFADNVDVIQRNVESCTRTIRDLLDYATDAVPEVGGVDVNATLEDVSAFLRPIRERSGVDLHMDLGPEPLEVTGDEVQIRQVFVNLIVNAIQAVGSGGHVSVESTAEDGFAVVHVVDDGCGIPRAVHEKIFRPFFTTKERGEGTGLGLPTARRIAEMHGGGLDLVSSGEAGTQFRVRLRRRPEDAL